MPPKKKEREFTGVCVFCGSGALQMNGVTKHGQRYRCKGCGRVMCGFPVPEATLAGRQSTAHPFRCPKCKGEARVHAREADGRCRLRCMVCGRNFTDGYRVSPPDMSTGPFPHKKTFNLNIPASKGLAALCQAKGMSAVQAIRFVLCEAAGDLPPTPEEVGTVLNDIRPVMVPQLVARRMWGHRGYGLVVLVVERVRVCLNDTAKAGLVRTMARLRCDHQAALRHLLAERSPEPCAVAARFREWLMSPVAPEERFSTLTGVNK